MYTLRRVNKDLSQNTFLGNQYTYIDRYTHRKNFRHIFNDEIKVEHVADLDFDSTKETRDIVGFVQDQNANLIPIFSNHDVFIMTNDGKTFERLNKAFSIVKEEHVLDQSK